MNLDAVARMINDDAVLSDLETHLSFQRDDCGEDRDDRVLGREVALTVREFLDALHHGLRDGQTFDARLLLRNGRSVRVVIHGDSPLVVEDIGDGEADR